MSPELMTSNNSGGAIVGVVFVVVAVEPEVVPVVVVLKSEVVPVVVAVEPEVVPVVVAVEPEVVPVVVAVEPEVVPAVVTVAPPLIKKTKLLILRFKLHKGLFQVLYNLRCIRTSLYKFVLSSPVCFLRKLV